MLNAWAQGTLTLTIEQEARGYVLTTHMVENLSLDQVREFYGLGPFADRQPEKARP